MRLRKFTATVIFDGTTLLKDVVLIIKKDGTIEALVNKSEAGENIEAFEGILTPGLINAHCHLELSHMKNKIPPGTGLINFLKTIITTRNNEPEETIVKKIEEGEAEMYRNGIVGVADICNTLNAIKTKKESKIRWYNLIEIINLFDSTLPDRLAFNVALQKAHIAALGAAVLTPHAPYTVSTAAYKAINEASANKVISIHNQETKAEDELYKTGKGEFLDMYAALGIAASPIIISGKSSLQTYLPFFTKGQTVLLVHNSFITEADVLFAKEYARANFLNIVYCLCPNANLYIENALPPVDMLLKHDCTIVVGTDSYSSNWSLNIAAELQTLLKNFPSVELPTALQWATSVPAKALGWTDLGYFATGIKPGIVLLGFDEEENNLTGKATRVL